MSAARARTCDGHEGEGITYKNNSKDYDDFQKGESFLQLSKTERDMIDLVTSNFKKVTLVYNGANTFQFDFLNDYPQIQSVVWCPPAGQTGFSALGEVLAGETNPSGKTSDTFLKDLTKSVSYNNFGKFEYTNMADKAAKYKASRVTTSLPFRALSTTPKASMWATSSMRPLRTKA